VINRTFHGILNIIPSINHPSIHLAIQAKALGALYQSSDDTRADIENVML
jgi:hypothetical protein